MDGWNYFKIVSMLYGGLLILRIPTMIMTSWGWLGSGERRPAWALPLGVVGIFLIVLTWYVHAMSPVEFSWVATLILTIANVKLVQAMLSRRRFQTFALRVASDPIQITRLDLALGAMGILLVIFGIFVY
jgi:hypothetical protein